MPRLAPFGGGAGGHGSLGNLEIPLSDRACGNMGRLACCAIFETARRDARLIFTAETAEHHKVLRVENHPMTRRFLKLNRVTHSAFPGAIVCGTAP